MSVAANANNIPASCKAAGCNGCQVAQPQPQAAKVPKEDDIAIQKLVQAALHAPAGGGPGTQPFNDFCKQLVDTVGSYRDSCAAEEEKKRNLPQKVFDLQQTVVALQQRLAALERATQAEVLVAPAAAPAAAAAKAAAVKAAGK